MAIETQKSRIKGHKGSLTSTESCTETRMVEGENQVFGSNNFYNFSSFQQEGQKGRARLGGIMRVIIVRQTHSAESVRGSG